MKIYLAPLQGITDWIFREAYAEYFDGIDKYFSPFIRIESGTYYRPNQKKDILPENNVNQKPIPQFLGNDFESFRVFEDYCLEQGYKEVNLNFGCPYPMVTSKKFGAGILEHPEIIEDLLDKIFASTKLRISVKSRLGLTNPENLLSIVHMLNKYPLEELIVHPRTANQMYSGPINTEAFSKVEKMMKIPIGYNGDIKTMEHIGKIEKMFPNVHSIMIGRGLVENPQMLIDKPNRDMFRQFCVKMVNLCERKYSGDAAILKRLLEMWMYHHTNFPAELKLLKKVKKCKKLNDYKTMLETL